MQISKRLNVEGPDHDGDYELTLSECGDIGNEYHYITRAEADALIAALQPAVLDASGRLVAPAQHEPATRPPGPWDSNTTGE